MSMLLDFKELTNEMYIDENNDVIYWQLAELTFATKIIFSLLADSGILLHLQPFSHSTIFQSS